MVDPGWPNDRGGRSCPRRDGDLRRAARTGQPAAGVAGAQPVGGHLPRRDAEALGRPHHLDAQRHHQLRGQRPRSERDAPGSERCPDRLFQNQVDIGNAIKPYYGDERGDQLTALLHDHIAIAGEILQAVKTGDTAAYQDANARWYANAHDIAVFFSETLDPPLGSLAEMDAMMKDHLDNTTAEVVARLTGEWTADVAAYDKVHNQVLEMADMLSDGIIANFPAKFRP